LRAGCKKIAEHTLESPGLSTGPGGEVNKIS
jgi:hypothetical protein